MKPIQDAIDQLNAYLKDRFDLARKIQAETQAHQAKLSRLNAKHAKRLAKLEKYAAELDGLIWSLIEHNRTALIKEGKQSFTIMMAVFQLRHQQAKMRITDANGIMNVARRLGVVPKIGRVHVSWKLDREKFLCWLQEHPELRHSFDEFIEETPAGETLTARPNDNYTVNHDSKRLVPPSVAIRVPQKS